MSKFEISGKEYEIKLDFKAVQELNKQYSSPLEFVGEIVSGSLSAFINCVYAGLQHTGKGFGRTMIEKEIEEQIEGEKLDLSDIMRIGYEVVENCFFYKKTVNNLLDKDPNMKSMLKDLMK